ncbi:DUF757-domain-containing protein [Ramicandelaber brevisporus]|nr:DUF757-domain-containing protein [Ramicandelaber brevisporus]
MPLPRAEDLEQVEEIEQQWAVKAMTYAETHFKLISSLDVTNLKLTKVDDELLADFQKTFPGFKIDVLDEDNDFKSPGAKEKWRNFINKYENKVVDFNFGSLLRLDASGEYTEENSMFVTRTQFYCIEIARNRAGLNKVHLKKKN